MVIVADEAQEMSEAMLVELRFLVNYQMDSRSLFPLILVGQSELRRIFRLKNTRLLLSAFLCNTT